MPTTAERLGTNVTGTLKGNILTLEIDISKSQGDSKSGKTVIVASSGGNVTVPGTDGLKLGLNAYRPK